MKKVTGRTELMTAVADRDLTRTVQLLAAGDEVNVINKKGETPLNLCLGETTTVTNIALAEFLLRAGADPNSCTEKYPHEERPQPMLHAFIEGKFSRRIIDMMVNFGANVESLDNDNSTPLLIAAGENDVAAVKLLLKAGANYDHVNKYGECVLNFIDSANSRLGLKVLNLLLAAGMSPNVRHARQEGQHSFLHTAARIGANEFIIPLLDAGADINIQCENKNTPLHEAVVINESANLLLLNGADINAQNCQGKTPLMVMIGTRHGGLIKDVLEAHGHEIDFTLKNDDGETVLSYAKRLLKVNKEAEAKHELEHIVRLLSWASTRAKTADHTHQI